jgi:hypothetical protein
MVDEALYKDILLAVAARKQNESTLSSASEKLEQHLGRIEDSHNRVIQRENDAIEQFVAGITLSQEKIRAGHTARMKAVILWQTSELSKIRWLPHLSWTRALRRCIG